MNLHPSFLAQFKIGGKVSSEQNHERIYASKVIVWSATLVLSSFFSMSGRLVIIPLSVLIFSIINASFKKLNFLNTSKKVNTYIVHRPFTKKNDKLFTQPRNDSKTFGTDTQRL